MSPRQSFLSVSCFIWLSLFILLLVHPAPNAYAEDAGIVGYKGMDFSFSYPAAWNVSTTEAFGSSVAGNLSLDASCRHFSLHWIRDPGFSTQEILNQIEENYNRGSVSISSAERGTIEMPEQNGERLTLTYEFKGSKRTRTIAAWNSSLSDRVFLASFSGCESRGGINSDGIDTSFERIISSFIDHGTHDKIDLEPSPSAGAWPIVLDDLLSTYHYKDSGTLPAGVVHTQVNHELSWINGSYSLDSREDIWADPLQTAVQRAGAVLHILQSAGYEAKPVQRSGEIGVAVRGPDGKWVLVSINPKDPARMVGVLGNETREFLVYSNFLDLVNGNGIKSNIKSHAGNDLDQDRISIVQKDCEPSRYVELKVADHQEDNSWLKGLRDELKSHEYRRYYEKNIFDCSSTAQICWSTLTEKGYDAKLILSYKGHPLEEHMWVAVETPYEKGGYVAVETANVDENKWLVNLGRVVTDEAYFRGIMYNTSEQFSWMHPEEGM